MTLTGLLPYNERSRHGAFVQLERRTYRDWLRALEGVHPDMLAQITDPVSTAHARAIQTVQHALFAGEQVTAHAMLCKVSIETSPAQLLLLAPQYLELVKALSKVNSDLDATVSGKPGQDMVPAHRMKLFLAMVYEAAGELWGAEAVRELDDLAKRKMTQTEANDVLPKFVGDQV